MKKICPVCGKVFDAKNPRYKYCTRECARTQWRVQNLKYNHSDKGRKAARLRERKKARQRYLANPKLCASCGTPLPNGCQTYCIDCLLRDYKQNRTKKAYQRLSCRGFGAQEIWELIKMKGI